MNVIPSICSKSSLKRFSTSHLRSLRRSFLQNFQVNQPPLVPTRDYFRQEAWISDFQQFSHRPTTVPLLRIRLGHTNTRSHWGRFSIRSSTACRRCNHPSETPEHLLLHCPRVQPDLIQSRTRFRTWVNATHPTLTFNQLVLLNTEDFFEEFKLLLHSARANLIYL